MNIKLLIETKEDLNQLSNNSTKRDAIEVLSSLYDEADQKNISEKEQIETELKSIQEKQKLENKINITDSMKISGQNVAQSSSCKSDDNNQRTESEQMTVPFESSPVEGSSCLQDKNYETNEVLKITHSMISIENVKQLNEPKADIMEQTVKSLDKDLDLQNKSLTSEYVKEQMKPDSLESVITDGKISKNSLEVSKDESVVDRMALNRDQNREGKEIEESCYESNQQKDETSKGLNETKESELKRESETKEPIESESDIINKETEDITPKVEAKSQWDITDTNKLPSNNGDKTKDAVDDHSLINVTIGQSDHNIEKGSDGQQMSNKGQILDDSVLNQTSAQRDDIELKQSALELGQSPTIEKGLKELEEEKTVNVEESNVYVLGPEKEILAEGICVEDVSVEEKNFIENKRVNEKPINSSMDGSVTQMKEQVGEDWELKTEEKTLLVTDKSKTKTEVIGDNAKEIKNELKDSQIKVSEQTQDKSDNISKSDKKKEEKTEKYGESEENKSQDIKNKEDSKELNNFPINKDAINTNRKLSTEHEESDNEILGKLKECDLKTIDESKQKEEKRNDIMEKSVQSIDQSNSTKGDIDKNQAMLEEITLPVVQSGSSSLLQSETPSKETSEKQLLTKEDVETSLVDHKPIENTENEDLKQSRFQAGSISSENEQFKETKTEKTINIGKSNDYVSDSEKELLTNAIQQKDVSEKDQKVILKEEDIKHLEKPIDKVTDISDKKNDQFVEVLQVKEKTQIVADNNNAKTEVIEGNAKGIRTTQEDSQVIVSEPTQSQNQDRFETIEKKEEEVKKCKETTEIKPLIETKEDLSQLSNNSTKRDAIEVSSSLHDEADQKNILEKEQIETELKSIQEKQKLENKINITDSMKISGQNTAQSSSCKSDDNNQRTKSEQMTVPVESSQGSSCLQDKDLDLQNKSLTSEYLKEEMKSDSLESVITDGKISKHSLEVSKDKRMAINREGKEVEESYYEGNQEKDKASKGLNDTKELIESGSNITSKETEDISTKVEVKSQSDITDTNKLTSNNGDKANDVVDDHSLITVTIGHDIEKSFDGQQMSTKGQVLADSVLDPTSGLKDDKELKQRALELGQSSTIEKGLKELEEEKTVNVEESNVYVFVSEKDILAEGICVEDVSVEEKNVIENKGVNEFEKPINSSMDGSEMKDQFREESEVKTEEKTLLVTDKSKTTTEVVGDNAKEIKNELKYSQIKVSEQTQDKSDNISKSDKKKEEKTEKYGESEENKSQDIKNKEDSKELNNFPTNKDAINTNRKLSTEHEESDNEILGKLKECDLKTIDESKQKEEKRNSTKGDIDKNEAKLEEITLPVVQSGSSSLLQSETRSKETSEKQLLTKEEVLTSSKVKDRRHFPKRCVGK